MDKLEFMDGQIKALMNFVTAVIQSHPTPDILRHHFEKIARADPNSPEGLSLSEAYIDGVADVDRRIAVALEHALERRQRHAPQPD